MIVVESPLTEELKLEPLILTVGGFSIDIVPFVISFLRLIQTQKIRIQEQFDAFLRGMVDTLNELLEDGVLGRKMDQTEEDTLRLSVTLRIYQILVGVGEPGES